MEKLSESLLEKKMSSYISMIVDASKSKPINEQIFDYFCQTGGVDILTNLHQLNSLVAIKCYSLLFINLQYDLWITFFLCQPFLRRLLQSPKGQDEEWEEYFISLLKSLSIRIDESQITLFYNKQCSVFPLIFQTMKYMNHPDQMVKANIMNIILQIMKIKDDRVKLYFSRFPFTIYIIGYCIEVRKLIDGTNQQLSKVEDRFVAGKIVKSYQIDLSDYLFYLGDLFTYGTVELNRFIIYSFLVFVIFPICKRILSENETEVRHSLVILSDLFKIIKNKSFLECVTRILCSKSLSKDLIQRIMLDKIYIPKVYTLPYEESLVYWDDYMPSITKHCLEIFSDVQQFDIQVKQMSQQKIQELQEELQRISDCIGVEVWHNKVIDKQIEFLQKGSQKQQSDKMQLVSNPFRELFQSYIDSDNQQLNLIVTSITSNLFNHDLSQNVRRQCDLLIKKQGQKETILEKVFHHAYNKITQQLTQDHSLITYKIYLITLSTLAPHFGISEEQERQLIKCYKFASQRLIKHIVIANMELIVENFEKKYQIVNEQFRNQEYSLDYNLILRKQLKNYKSSDHFYTDYQILPPSEIQTQKFTYQHRQAQKKIILYLIQKFAIFRSFFIFYSSTLHTKKSLKQKFFENYINRFQKTTLMWKVSNCYKISSKSLILCTLEIPLRNNKKETKKVMIVEDQKNLVIIEAISNNSYIIINSSWKSVQFEISRDNSCAIDFKYQDQKRLLIFEDELRCNMTNNWMKKVTKNRYEEEHSFILQFVKKCIQE